MKKPLVIWLFGLFLLAAPLSQAQARQQPPVPELINQGFTAYAQSGLNAALQAWLQNSLLDRNTLLRNEMLALKQADTSYGLFESGEVVQQVVLTSRVTRVYLVLYYERSPLWAYFDLYKTRSGTEVISNLFFSTKVQVILPSEYLLP